MATKRASRRHRKSKRKVGVDLGADIDRLIVRLLERRIGRIQRDYEAALDDARGRCAAASRSRGKPADKGGAASRTLARRFLARAEVEVQLAQKLRGDLVDALARAEKALASLEAQTSFVLTSAFAVYRLEIDRAATTDRTRLSKWLSTLGPGRRPIGELRALLAKAEEAVEAVGQDEAALGSARDAARARAVAWSQREALARHAGDDDLALQARQRGIEEMSAASVLDRELHVQSGARASFDGALVALRGAIAARSARPIKARRTS